jgi:hypothetical protein
VSEISDSLRKEPVRAFNQATARNDTSIAQLRELASVAPAEIPKIGRAWIDDTLDAAQKSGRVEGAKGMFRDWHNLGSETKQMLFGHVAGLEKELDNFFLAAKRLAEDVNPSGTAHQGMIVGQGVSAGGTAALALTGNVWPLMLFTGGQSAAYALAKAMRSPTTLRVLTQGMNAPKGSVSAIVARQTFQRLIAEANREKDKKKP